MYVTVSFMRLSNGEQYYSKNDRIASYCSYYPMLHSLVVKVVQHPIVRPIVLCVSGQPCIIQRLRCKVALQALHRPRPDHWRRRHGLRVLPPV